MSLSKKDIEEIMDLLEDSRFDRLSLEMDGLKLELVRQGAARAETVTPQPVPPPPPSPPPGAKKDAAAVAPAREGLVAVNSPLLGVFYRAPKPGEPPFVEVGSRVEPDTVIGIIEVMKLMNSARAGVAGEIAEIVGENGEMVEHGECLMFVRPD